jgi:protein TonB
MKAIIAVVVLLAGSSWGLAGQDQSASPSPTPTPSPTATPSSSPHGPAPGTKRIRVSSGVAEKQLRHNVDPVYPSEARRNYITGDVFLRIIIDRQGNVAEVYAVKGDAMLVESAVKAVKKWKYRPYILDGESVEMDAPILIKYRM